MFDEPLFFKPLMFERVWGGNHLGALYGKPIAPGKIIGESWELSDRADAQSVVDGGVFDGWTLRQLIEKYPREILGELASRERFPLLIKYVDAGDKLSVQVHPDDAGARKFNDLGKSECWVVVRAEPGAKVVRGLKPGTSRAAFARAVEENRVEDLLHAFEPKVGDVIALPAGMVHAIGKGLVVAEVQQNSDVTLRIYDYGRLGLDGKPRRLHVKEAMDAIRFDGPGDEFDGDMLSDTVVPVVPAAAHAADESGLLYEELLKGRYFDLQRIATSNPFVNQQRFFDFKSGPHLPRVAMVIEGDGWIHDRAVRAGMTCLLPAAASSAAIHGELTLLLATPK